MSKIGLIIEREYLTRVKKKTFIILTLLTPILMAALVAVPLLLSFVKSSDRKEIVVSDRSGLYMDRLKSNQQFHFSKAVESLESYKQKVVKDEGFNACLFISGNLNSDTSKVALYSGKQVEMDLKNFISNQLDSLARNDKIKSYHIAELEKIIEETNPTINLNTIKLDQNGGEKESSSELAMFIGMMCTIIIYIFIFAYGSMVMNGVIEEKTNRIVEVIVSSVKPFELMMGKIIGIALVGLTQVLLWVVLIVGILGIVSIGIGKSVSPEKMAKMSTQMASSQSMGIHPTNLPTATVPELTDASANQSEINNYIQTALNLNFGEIFIWFILYFLGGYLLYASLFAAVGSAIDNQEEATQFILPLTMLVLFGLYAGMYSSTNPDGPLALWCSLIPFTSPIVMMVRIPFGVPIWQLMVSYALLVATFLLSTKMASKIYRTGILMYGKKPSYKELWKWLKYKN